MKNIQEQNYQNTQSDSAGSIEKKAFKTDLYKKAVEKVTS